MTLQAGDIGWSRGTGLFDWAIQKAQERRYGKGSPLALWNHNFVMINGSELVEARARGMVRINYREYWNTQHMVMRPFYPLGGTTKLVAEALEMVKRGDDYGYLEMICLTLAYYTGTKLRFGVEGHRVCSGAAARLCVVGGLDMGDDMNWNSPADNLNIATNQGWVMVT